MFPPTSPQKEYPSTYFIQDRSSQDELKRLQQQDRMITTGIGGLLPEQKNTAPFRRVLDAGCGTGGWLIEMAKIYPTTTLLVGVDVSKRMVEYAREQAKAQQADERVEFQIMDILRGISFHDNHFDLVNQRLGISFLRTWEWQKVLREYVRVTRPGGIIRITEAEPTVATTSASLKHLCSLFLQALYQAGHLFAQEDDGLTSHLAGVMSRYRIENVQQQAYPLQYRAGTKAWLDFFEDAKNLFRAIVPFLRKWIRVPDDYDDIYKQALEEMREPDFVATWNLLTVWGTSP